MDQLFVAPIDIKRFVRNLMSLDLALAALGKDHAERPIGPKA